MTAKPLPFHTAFLLSIARYTHRFYPVVYHLKGRDVTWKNPGTSLKSWLVANALDQELTILEEGSTVHTVLQECFEFCQDDTSEAILEHLFQAADDLMRQVSLVVSQVPEKEGQTLINLSNQCSSSLEQVHANLANAASSISESETEKVLPIYSPLSGTDESVQFRYQLYFVQDLITKLTDALADLPRSPEVA